MRRFWRNRAIKQSIATLKSQIKLSDTEASLVDKRWQEQADQLAAQGLAQIRATASAWTLTIGGLSSLFGLSIVIKGRSDLSGLAPGTGIAVGLLTLGALVLAIAAVYTGALAAQGSSSTIWDSGPSLKTWTKNQTSKAVKLLGASRILILASLALLILSMVVDWYGPSATQNNQTKSGVWLVLSVSQAD